MPNSLQGSLKTVFRLPCRTVCTKMPNRFAPPPLPSGLCAPILQKAPQGVLAFGLRSGFFTGKRQMPFSGAKAAVIPDADSPGRRFHNIKKENPCTRSNP